MVPKNDQKRPSTSASCKVLQRRSDIWSHPTEPGREQLWNSSADLIRSDISVMISHVASQIDEFVSIQWGNQKRTKTPQSTADVVPQPHERYDGHWQGPSGYVFMQQGLFPSHLDFWCFFFNGCRNSHSNVCWWSENMIQPLFSGVGCFR